MSPPTQQTLTGHSQHSAAHHKWLALHFPKLPLDIFRCQGVPDEQVQIVIQEQRVCQMNEAAAATGILPGCTLATAYSIRSELTYFERNPGQEQERLADLAQALYRYSSVVSLEPPDCIVLEIRGSLLLLGSADIIAQDALALCADMNHYAIARSAQTPQAAIALARAQTDRLFDVPLHVLEFLNQGFSQHNLERLSNMGIYTLGQLAQLPRAGLGKRFGQQLTQYLGRLQGELPDPRQSIRPQTRFFRQQHLLKPINNKEVLLRGPMPYLAKQLEHWLIAQQHGCINLCWQFAPFKGEPTELQIRFGGGKQRHQDILKLSTLKLEQVDLPSEVLTVGLDMTLSRPWVSNNQDLFGSTASATIAVSELVDELSARLGTEACHSIRPRTQHHPEQAWRGLRGIPRENKPAITSDPAATNGRSAGVLPGKRPLWLFHQPQPVPGDHLTLLQGPERLSEPMSHSMANDNSSTLTAAAYRDYYVARHRQGALCWVFTSPQPTPRQTERGGDWYLHGYFA